MMTGLFGRKNSEILVEFALSEGLLFWSPFYRTETMIFFTCKEKLTVVFDLGKGGKAVAYVYYLICFFVGIPLLKDGMENQSYREDCRRKGYATYWSTDGLRYTSTNRKVYK